MADAPSVPSDLIPAEALLHEGETPSFAEPWMAQAFACAIHLSRRGVFTWTEWVEVFSTEIKTHPQQRGETANSAYYRQWLAALETIVGRKGAASTAEITERQEAWRRAYLNTPHGQPVELENAAAAPAAHGHDHQHSAPDHHHHHGRAKHDAPKPIAVSPAQRA